MKLTNKQYNFIKYLITIALPAFGTFYFTIAQIWDFERVPGVNGTISAICTFLGLLIVYSSKQYNQSEASKKAEEDDRAVSGDLVVAVDPETGEKALGLAVKGSVDQLTANETVKLNVVLTNTPPTTE